MQDIVFGSGFNGAIGAVLKKGGGSGKANVAEILEIESVQQRLQCCVRKKDDELSAERALDSDMVVDKVEEEDEVTRLNRGSIIPQPGRYQKGSSEHLAATAAQSLAIYVNLVPEPETQKALEKAIQNSPLSKDSVTGTPGPPSLRFSDKISCCFMFCIFCYFVSVMSNLLRKNCVLIHFDADLATESHARPNYRPPPMTECLAKKLIYAALAGRGAKAVKTNSEPDCPIPGDVLCILDGGRDSPALMTPFKQGKGLAHSVT